MSDELLSGWKAICRFMGCSRSSAMRWARDGALPVIRRDGGMVFARRDALERWLFERDG